MSCSFFIFEGVDASVTSFSEGVDASVTYYYRLFSNFVKQFA